MAVTIKREERNLLTVKRLYDAFKRRDIATILTMSTDDVSMHGPAPANVVPWGGTHRGREGVNQFFKKLGESLEPQRFELREFIAQDDKVAVLGYQQGRVKPTGKPYEIEFVHLWRIAEDKFSEFRVYNDTASLADALHE